MNYDNNQTDYSAYRPKGYPVRHKEKIPFNPTLKINPKYREIVHQIREMDNALDEMVLSGDDYLGLVVDAYSSNIHWSVKIEGNNLPFEEVKKMTALFTAKKYNEETASGPTQEILNHLYSYVMRNRFKLPWTADTAMDVHSMLLEKTGIDCPLGQFRKEQVSIAGSDGFEYFIACPPKNIENEMASLMDWLRDSPYDEIVTSALFFHEFESIHPFQDGNGRTGRTLFQILLQELGFKNSKLCKFEQKLLDPPETYYTLLAYTDATADYGPFATYIAESLLSAYEEAYSAFEEKNLIKDLDESSKTIIKKAKKNGRFTVSDACNWVPALGEQTIRSKLNNLINLDLLEKNGKTRSTSFMFRDPLRDFAEESPKSSENSL
jgi:Fic family protein